MLTQKLVVADSPSSLDHYMATHLARQLLDGPDPTSVISRYAVRIRTVWLAPS